MILPFSLSKSQYHGSVIVKILFVIYITAGITIEDYFPIYWGLDTAYYLDTQIFTRVIMCGKWRFLSTSQLITTVFRKDCTTLYYYFPTGFAVVVTPSSRAINRVYDMMNFTSKHHTAGSV